MVSDLTATGSVTRTSLSLANLDFGPDSGYYIQRDGVGPGEKTFRRQTVTSQYVPGRYLTHAVSDSQTLVLKLHVAGSSQTQVRTRIETLKTAFEQFSYTLTLNIGDETFSYLCEPADFTLGEGGNFQDLWLRSNRQAVSFSIPHFPVAGI